MWQEGIILLITNDLLIRFIWFSKISSFFRSLKNKGIQCFSAQKIWNLTKLGTQTGGPFPDRFIGCLGGPTVGDMPHGDRVLLGEGLL
jgi:hypothetical protein